MDSRNVKYLVLGKELTPKVSGTVNEVSDLANGTIAVVKPHGEVLYHGFTGFNAQTELRLVINYDGALMYTPFFKGANVIKSVRRKYHTQEEQIDYIGYNYTSGLIDPINDNQYNIRDLIIEYDQSGQLLNKMVYGMYHSLVVDTPSNIAYSLCRNFQTNVNQGAIQHPMYVDRVYSGAVTEKIGAGTPVYLTLAVVKGSKWVTLSAVPTVAVVVGDILNLAGLAFIVKTLSSTSPTTLFELDLAWQHPSGYVVWDEGTAPSQTINVTNGSTTATLSDNAIAPFNVIGTVVYFDIANVFYSATMATATQGVRLDLPYKGTTNASAALGGGLATAGADWGLRLQGRKRSFVTPRTDKFSKVRFSTKIENFGLTTVTEWNTAKEGCGNFEQVAELEWFCQGFEGLAYKGDHLQNVRSEVLNTGKYDILTIDFTNPVGPFPLGDNVAQPIQIVVAIDNAAGGNHFVALEAVLDDSFTILQIA